MRAIHGGDIYRNLVSIDFSVNVNPLGIPQEVEEALHRVVGRCHEYPDITCGALKRAVGSMLSIPEEYLLFGNGASELFMGIVHALKPKRIMIPVPSFYGYEYVAMAADSDITYFQMRETEEFLPTEDLLQALTGDIDMLFLANPNNPTGKLMSREYLEKLLKRCRERKICVVLDECFIDFCKSGESMVKKLGDYDNLLLVRAFTKIFSIPGVRLGYLACSNAGLLERIKRQLPEWNLSAFAQAAGIACACQRAFVAETVEYVEKERQFLTEGLKRLGICVYESETNFILIYSKKQLYSKLLEQGILIRDCGNFRGLSEGYYRIAVKTGKENERLLKAVGELQ